MLTPGLLVLALLSPGELPPGAPRVRVSLDDAATPTQALTQRRIRQSLDDEGGAAQPPAAASSGRLIRLTLDIGQTVYGRIGEGSSRGRHMRTSLE